MGGVKFFGWIRRDYKPSRLDFGWTDGVEDLRGVWVGARSVLVFRFLFPII